MSGSMMQQSICGGLNQKAFARQPRSVVAIRQFTNSRRGFAILSSQKQRQGAFIPHVAAVVAPVGDGPARVQVPEVLQGLLQDMTLQQPHDAQQLSEARAIGVLVGALCGNVLGAPVEGDRHWQVTRMFPAGLTDFWVVDMNERPLAQGQCTGDFLVLLAISRSLVDAGACDKEAVAGHVAEGCDPAARRYSPYTQLVVDVLRDGGAALGDLPRLASSYLASSQASSTASDRLEREPWGPADNGAAARIPPVAVAYAFAPPEVLQAAVQEACAISHNDPMGQDGAWVAAAAIQWLLRRPRVQHHQEPSSSQQPASTISRSPSQHGSTEADELLAYLQSVARTSDMQEKLQLLRDNLFQVKQVTSWQAFYRGRDWNRLVNVLNRLTYHDAATMGTEAVAVALWALTTSWGHPRQALSIAAAFAGSAPITTQIAGALAGAAYGDSWVPATWWEQLENQPLQPAASGDEEEDGGSSEGQQGQQLGLRDEVVQVAKQLSQLRCTRVGRQATGQEYGQDQ